MKLDFTYFEYKDIDGLWKTHPVESVKCITIIGTGTDPFYPAWKSGHCLAVAYFDNPIGANVTDRIFDPMRGNWDHYQKTGQWKEPGYVQIRLVSACGMRIPLNTHEGNLPHYNYQTHCIFGYIGANLFGMDWEFPTVSADKQACPSTNTSAASAVTSSTNL